MVVDMSVAVILVEEIEGSVATEETFIFVVDNPVVLMLLVTFKFDDEIFCNAVKLFTVAPEAERVPEEMELVFIFPLTVNAAVEMSVDVICTDVTEGSVATEETCRLVEDRLVALMLLVTFRFDDEIF